MRTKALLGAAIIAAGALTSMAQSNVYSLNVVGYVNVKLVGGGSYNMIANPLNNTAANGNNITNLFAAIAQDGDQIFRWDVNAYDFSGVQPTYSAFSHTWNSDFSLNPGEGVWYINNGSDSTNTFVGEVIQGSYTNVLQGDGSYNAIASSAPVGGSFTNAIAGLVPADGDQIFPWDVNAYDFSGTQPTYSAFSHSWSVDYTIPPGSGFIYIRNGSGPQTWVRNFTVQ